MNKTSKIGAAAFIAPVAFSGSALGGFNSGPPVDPLEEGILCDKGGNGNGLANLDPAKFLMVMTSRCTNSGKGNGAEVRDSQGIKIRSPKSESGDLDPGNSGANNQAGKSKKP